MTIKAIYPLRDNWHLFQPYLDHPDVREALQNGMDAWKANREPGPYTDRSPWNEDVDGGPWALCDKGWYWLRFSETVEDDEEFQSEANVYVQKYNAEHPDAEAEDGWLDWIESDEYTALHSRIGERYKPKRGELDYYRLNGGCHWVVEFVYELIQLTIPYAQEWGTVTTDTHSIAYLVQDDVMYFVELLYDFSNVDELETFMGGPIDLLPVADDGLYTLPPYIESMQCIRRVGDKYAVYIVERTDSVENTDEVYVQM